MIKVEHSTVINRPLNEVFEFVVDPNKEPEWQEGVLEAGYSPGSAPGVGAEIFEKRKFMGREMVSKFQVTQYEANKLFVGKVTEGPVKFEVIQSFEAVDGGTKVSITVQGEPGGFFKLAEGMVKKQLQSQLVSDFEHAKKMLEG